MKILKIILIISCVMFWFVNVYAIHQTMPSETFVPLPGPFADSIYKYITVENSYRNWSLWPGKGRHYKGTEPHGALLTTYISDNARVSIKSGEKMIDGSIVVKESYSPDKKLLSVSVMYKIKDYYPAGGDWFWAEYEAGGKVVKAGKLNDCMGCHSQVESNDYVFTGQFVK